jgi:site-specific recombinase XerD
MGNNDVSIGTIQKILDHQNRKTMEIYATVLNEMIKKERRKYDIK